MNLKNNFLVFNFIIYQHVTCNEHLLAIIMWINILSEINKFKWNMKYENFETDNTYRF